MGNLEEVRGMLPSGEGPHHFLGRSCCECGDESLSYMGFRLSRGRNSIQEIAQ